MDNYKDVLSFFETIDDLMMVVSLEGSVLYVNRAVIDKLEYSYTEIYEKNMGKAFNIWRDIFGEEFPKYE